MVKMNKFFIKANFSDIIFINRYYGWYVKTGKIVSK